MGTKIIAAYAGAGKTYAAKKLGNVLDMCVVPYKYKFPPEYKLEQYTSDMECMDPILPDYFDFFVEDLIGFVDSGRYEYVLIPSDIRVLNMLDERGVDYTLYYPSWECQEEYVSRFIERGDSATLLHVYGDGFFENVLAFRSRKCPKVVMQPGEFLLDLLAS